MRRTGVLGLAGLVLVLAACASRESIEVRYGEQLNRLRRGMSAAEFRQLLPAAREHHRLWVGAERVVVYRLEHRYKPDELPAETQVLYFVFVDDQLRRWGYSETWPGQG